MFFFSSLLSSAFGDGYSIVSDHALSKEEEEEESSTLEVVARKMFSWV